MESIGDFAESLVLGSVQGIQEGKELPPSAGGGKPSPGTPDIRNTRIPDSFMSQVLGEQYVSQQEEEEVIEEQAVEEEIVEQPSIITESQASEMIDLLREVKGLLQEMTTTGSLGTNMSGQSPKQYDKSCKDEEKRKGYKPATASSILRDNLKKRLRSKR